MSPHSPCNKSSCKIGNQFWWNVYAMRLKVGQKLLHSRFCSQSGHMWRSHRINMKESVVRKSLPPGRVQSNGQITAGRAAARACVAAAARTPAAAAGGDNSSARVGGLVPPAGLSVPHALASWLRWITQQSRLTVNTTIGDSSHCSKKSAQVDYGSGQCESDQCGKRAAPKKRWLRPFIQWQSVRQDRRLERGPVVQGQHQ